MIFKYGKNRNGQQFNWLHLEAGLNTLLHKKKDIG